MDRFLRIVQKMTMDSITSISAIVPPQPVASIVRGVSIGVEPRTLGKPSGMRPDCDATGNDVSEATAEWQAPYGLSTSALLAGDGMSAHERGFQSGYQEGLEAGRKAGEEEGRQSGFEQGLTEGQQEAKRLIQEAARQLQEDASKSHAEKLHEQSLRLQKCMDAWSTQYTSLLEQHTDDLVALCFDAVTQVVGRLVQDPDQVVEMIRSALLHAGPLPNLHVHLHPDDFCMIENLMTKEPGRLPSGLQFKADAQISVGGVVLRSDRGSLDARLEIQMARFARFLLDQRKQSLACEAGQ